jgi:hypothetical protein
MKNFYTLLLFLFAAFSTFAQAPEKMSYQAVIRDATNTLLTNEEVGMQISILQTSITGTAVYIETQTATTNINGLVSIEIGTGTSSNNFSAIDWSAGPYFIKTATDPTGGTTYTITGTSQIMSVPFAMYAKTSGSSTPGPQGATGLQGEPGTTGTTGVTGAQGDIGATGAQGEIGTSGTTGIQGTTGETGAQGDIGATGAEGEIGISGATGIQGTTGETGAEGEIGTTGATGATGLQGEPGATGDIGPEGPSDNDWTVNGSDMYSANSGNVGIRTASPQGAFEVYSQAQPVTNPAAIDQSQTIGGWAAGSMSNWQSFTAGVSGQLTQVDLQVSSGSIDNSQNGTIKIYQGSGIGGTLLTTENVVFQQVYSTYQQFPLSGMPTLTAGLQYTIRFEIPTINVGWVYLNINNPYSGGEANNSDWDYLFKTYVASINPEESTLVVVDGNVGVGNITPVRSLHVNNVLRLEPRTTAPSAPAAGDMYFSAVTNKLMVHDGSTWNACW